MQQEVLGKDDTLSAGCHIDMHIYFKLRDPNKANKFIKNKNGEVIIFKLGLERQGQQHENSEEGFKTFLSLNRCPKLFTLYKEGRLLRSLHEAKYKPAADMHKAWKDQLNRDERKVKLYDYFESEHYYLLVIPHTIKPQDMQDEIIRQFKEKTGYDISDLGKSFNWKDIWTLVKLLSRRK